QLAALLETGGHTVRRMVREDRVGPGEISWSPKAGQLDPADLEGVDVVVNLAGRSIATRWTPAARREIRDSRINGTALISPPSPACATAPPASSRPPRSGSTDRAGPASCSPRQIAAGRGSSPT